MPSGFLNQESDTSDGKLGVEHLKAPEDLL